MKQLSIIIPAYNVKNYIGSLIDSIYKNNPETNCFEVIIVDDGSNDGTEAICDKLSEKYDNLTVLHQSNSGSPAGPRNKGILCASGEFVLFADADDYFYPDAIKKLIDYINNHSSDIVLFEIDATDWGKDFYKGMFSHSQNNCKVYNSKILNSLGPVKLFRRKLLLDNNIKFPENIAFEDLSFVLEAYSHAERISILAGGPYYKYVKRKEGGSLSTAKTSGGIFGVDAFSTRVEGIKNYLEVCKRWNSPEKLPQIYIRGIVYSDRLLPHLCRKFKYEEINKLKEIIKDVYCDHIRALLHFSTLTKIDALVYSDIDVLKAMIESWPDGPKTAFWYDEQKSVWYYKCSFDQIKDKFIIQTIPNNLGWGRKNLEDPHIIRNLITEAKLKETQITFKGHMDFLRKLDLKDDDKISAKIRFASQTTNGVSQSKVLLENLKIQKCFASVYKYEFDWEANIPLADFMPKMNKIKQQIAFYLDVFVGGIVIENRFGHHINVGVLTDFFDNAVLFNKEWILAPTVTGLLNISLNIIPVSVVQNTATDINVFVNESESKIVISGNQGFDNYPQTQVLAVLDEKYMYELQKGERRGNKEFKGIIHVVNNDENAHSIKIQSRLLGGAFDYTNIKFSYSVNNCKMISDEVKDPLLTQNNCQELPFSKIGEMISFLPKKLLSLCQNIKNKNS